VILREELRTAAAGGAQSLKGTQHFESCWKSSTGSVRKVSEEVRVTSSGGIVPFVNAVGVDPGEVRTGQSFGAEESPRRRIDGQDSQGRFARSREPSDLRKAERGLALECRRTKAHRGSAFGVWRGESHTR
jgi:hypothetical protein